MDLIAALAVLGVAPGTPMAEARLAFRDLIRAAHPDLAPRSDAAVADPHERAALITQAWAVVTAAGTTVPDASPPIPPGATEAAPAPGGRPPAAATASDTIGVAAPHDETWALLAEAASTVGEIAYVDRNLGILEAIVRFEGGPSCSLLITLQGRAWGTEAFCTLESIEAGATPPIAPVMDALLGALEGSGG